jgi:RNA polymerase sigma factor (sigma-70 family)
MTTTFDPSDVGCSDAAAMNGKGFSQALAALAPPLREVLVLRECRGWGYEQIAQALNVSRSVVHQRIADARREMLRMF